MIKVQILDYEKAQRYIEEDDSDMFMVTLCDSRG